MESVPLISTRPYTGLYTTTVFMPEHKTTLRSPYGISRRIGEVIEKVKWKAV